jgi:hypothetical protein
VSQIEVFKSILWRVNFFTVSIIFSSYAHADWYWYVLKVDCSETQLKIINYSAYNEEGEARAAESGVIDVNDLSTYRMTEEDLRVPDKDLPHVETCRIPSGSYEVVLTNAGGRWSAPFPIVNVTEVTNSTQPESLIKHLSLEDSYEYKKYEIIFSAESPKGKIIKEKICEKCQ